MGRAGGKMDKSRCPIYNELYGPNSRKTHTTHRSCTIYYLISHTRTHTHTHTHKHCDKQVHTPTHTHTCTHAGIHIHTNIHKHTHTHTHAHKVRSASLMVPIAHVWRFRSVVRVGALPKVVDYANTANCILFFMCYKNSCPRGGHALQHP
jgi:hypothetical protein